MIIKNKSIGIGIKTNKQKSDIFWINIKDDLKKYLKDNYEEIFKNTKFEIIIFRTELKQRGLKNVN